MNKIIIDYQYGTAEFYTNLEYDESIIEKFYSLASECFGLRKNLGEVKIESKEETKISEIIIHDGDTIIFDEKGDKIKSEWD